ncbi:MAG: hypothetical protein DYG98_23165 [Haliscomenobacteraceae bacterium CHB4]|nr:hypothetical protein [Saprospiraceae bacterium]MCE7925960.1 hypothetical protein [Haliscomenobacteraceae bacterium CHB4]
MLCLRLLPLFSAVILAAGSLDAQNDKQVIGNPVITPDDIAADASILYLIRFQNVGHDTVRNIVVRDTLDPRLNPNSFITLDASHDYQLLGEGGSVIRWYFENINLPDSASGGSHSIGFILFSIQPQPFVAPGQTILNRACISFDDLSTICTNETIVWVDGNSAVEAPPADENDWHVVPNPNHGQFEVRQDNIQTSNYTANDTRWWITDMSGRTVWDGAAANATAASNQILLEKPMPGHYLLWIQSGRSLEVERFAVIR